MDQSNDWVNVEIKNEQDGLRKLCVYFLKLPERLDWRY
jgi:hypothetical protein